MVVFTRLIRSVALLWIALFVSAESEWASGQDKGIDDFPKLQRNTDWPWWRGPMRNGIAIDQDIPIEFGEKRSLQWQCELPGRSHGSPIVVGQRVFLPVADEKDSTHSVIAVDRTNGKVLWRTEVNRGGFPTKNHPKNTEASPTLASDGERLFGCFFHHDAIHLVTLDLDGQLIRNQRLGYFKPKMFEYGYAPSPCLYQSNVIVCAEFDGDSFLVAIDRETGKEVWRTERPKSISFSSPVVAHVAGRDQLLISGNLKLSSYDPTTGELLWDVEGTTNATCGTMVWDGDIVVASGGYPKAETIAVKADGSRQVLWRNAQKCYEQSMMMTNGFVYALTDKGVLFCWDARNGEQKWLQRLKGPVSASPVLVRDRIYWANEQGTLYVFSANPNAFQLLAENQIGDESFASPAVCGGQIFLRVARSSDGIRKEVLMCFAQ
ncbi:MAG: PQQ-binding-like beta-propeller repeat protein [Pirellula sp.]|jgi:hypothetical protein|nr:PQQ-binding-like beta-propeller repeat protein [Pirellula sp.]